MEAQVLRLPLTIWRSNAIQIESGVFVTCGYNLFYSSSALENSFKANLQFCIWLCKVDSWRVRWIIGGGMDVDYHPILEGDGQPIGRSA